MRPAIPKPTGNDLKSISDFNSEWADRIALLILVGLVFDIADLFIANVVWQKGIAIAANVLIIGGVWGELWFAKRARKADDGRVAEANARAEEAKRETAELHARHAWRFVNLNQRNTLVVRLRSEPPSSIILWYPAGDQESANFAGHLGGVFDSAGWSAETRGGLYGILGRDFGLILPPHDSGGDARITRIAEALAAASVRYAHRAIPRAQTFISDAGSIALAPDDVPVEIFIGPNAPNA